MAEPTTRYLVLRAGRRFGPCAAESLSIDTIDARPDTLRHDPGVRALAPVVPLRAIAAPAGVADSVAALGLIALGVTNCPYDGLGVRIGLADSGVERAHRCFRGLAIEQRDFTGDGQDGDPSGHGTAVLSVVCGRDLDGRRLGVARGVDRVYVARVLDRHAQGDSSTLLRGLGWLLAQELDLILIGATYDLDRHRRGLPADIDPKGANAAVCAALEANEQALTVLTAAARHTLLVAPAGNDSAFPRRWEWLRFPASVPGVLAVGAVQQRAADGRWATHPASNHGVVLVAPGHNVLAARPGDPTGSTAGFGGTSAAAAYVAGLAALHLEALRAGSARDRHGADALFAALVASARRAPIADFHPDRHGHGLAQAPRPG